MARLVPAHPPTGLGLLVAAVRHLPLDLQARARRNAWAGMAEVRATCRARRDAEAALEALEVRQAAPERLAR